MTRTQLNYLYVFSKLSYSEDLQAISELKKVLLLELKSSENPVLTIENEHWSKNDILQFFESQLDFSFDYQLFISDYPWIENLKNPEKITFNKLLLSIDFSDKRFSEFAKSEGVIFQKSLLLLSKNYVEKLNFSGLNTLLLYKPCFTEAFQRQWCEKIQDGLSDYFDQLMSISLDNYNVIKSKATPIFCIANDEYYALLQELGKKDNRIIAHNMKVFKRFFPFYDYDEKLQISIIDRQLTLNHTLPGKEFLEGVKGRIVNRKENEKKYVPTNPNKTILKVVLFIVLGVIATHYIKIWINYLIERWF